ncbi:hypothetical protein JW796_03535 [Candidatus Dojkabacteria bacterium]|nr:hypothetical protein [Candidatus Dojkabacteria bacterium]
MEKPSGIQTARKTSDNMFPEILWISNFDINTPTNVGLLCEGAGYLALINPEIREGIQSELVLFSELRTDITQLLRYGGIITPRGIIKLNCEKVDEIDEIGFLQNLGIDVKKIAIDTELILQKIMFNQRYNRYGEVTLVRPGLISSLECKKNKSGAINVFIKGELERLELKGKLRLRRGDVRGYKLIACLVEYSKSAKKGAGLMESHISTQSMVEAIICDLLLMDKPLGQSEILSTF